MKNKNKIAVFIVALIAFVPLFSASAVSLKVSPAELEIKAIIGRIIQREITIENPGNDVALFEVYSDEFEDWIKITPESFTLQAGEKREVTVEVENSEQGIFSTYLSVVAKPLNSNKASANSGIKIPLQVTVSSQKTFGFFSAMLSSYFGLGSPVGILLVISVLVAILALVKLFVIKKKSLV